MFRLVFEALAPAEQIQKFNKFPQNIDQHRMWKAWWQLCPPGYRTILWPPSVRQGSGPWLSWTLAAFCVARLASGSPATLTLPSHLVIWKRGTTGIDHFTLWPEEVYIRNQFGGSTHMRPAWRTGSGVTPASWHATLIPGTSSAPQTLAEAGIETWTPTFTSPFTLARSHVPLTGWLKLWEDGNSSSTSILALSPMRPPDMLPGARLETSPPKFLHVSCPGPPLPCAPWWKPEFRFLARSHFTHFSRRPLGSSHAGWTWDEKLASRFLHHLPLCPSHSK